jgi:ribosomal protein S18 acetylase RimI-like enzyme
MPSVVDVTDAQLDALCAAAWPAAVVRQVGHWWCRSSGGFTNRANSVAVLGEHVTASPLALRAVERFYGGYGLRATYQVSMTARTAELRAALQRAGYEACRPTRVLVKAFDGADGHEGDVNVDLTGAFTEEWFDTWAQVETRAAGLPEAAKAQLERLPAPRRFALARNAQGRPASVAVGCVVDGWLAVAAVATLPAERGNGHATRIQATLQAWATRCGSEAAVLQVEESNVVAQRLYARAGFERRHQYQYLAA